VVFWASQQKEGDNYHICRWEEGVACRTGHSPETLWVDSHENMQLDPQSRSSQSEIRNGEVEEVHAFCNRLHRPYEPAPEGNRDNLEGGRQVFWAEDNRMGNEHHGEEVGNLEADTLRDTADTRGCGEEQVHNHAVDEFDQSMNCRQGGYGV
jgi:hypothetical protein